MNPSESHRLMGFNTPIRDVNCVWILCLACIAHMTTRTQDRYIKASDALIHTFPVVLCLAQLVDSRDVQQMWVLRRFDVSWWRLNLSIPSPMSFKLYAVLVADSTIPFYFCLGTITQYFRYSDSRPYGNYHRWNHFHLVSSESTICNVIFRQSLCRSARECLYVICVSYARFRWGSVVLLPSYPAYWLISYMCRGFNSGPSICIVLLNKILAVKHI
jgi:hypothetical protein